MDLSQALQIWWVYPVAVCISTVALSTGISGALFFSPFFLIVLGLAPAQAIGAGLMTELIGTSFATINYTRQKVVDFKIAKLLLPATIPLGIIGAYLAHKINPTMLQIFFGIAIIVLAIFLVYDSFLKIPKTNDSDLKSASGRIITAKDGKQYVCRDLDKKLMVPLAGIGAFFTGLISSGLPELITTMCMLKYKIPPRVAVASSIFVLSITVFFAAGMHAIAAQPAWHVVVWSIPGVITGAQIGPRIQGKAPSHLAQRTIGVLFFIVGCFVLIMKLGY